MRYILVSTSDSTIRKPIEVPEAIVSGRSGLKKKIRSKKPIKRMKQVKKTIQKSKAVIGKHGSVHNNNKRRAKSL